MDQAKINDQCLARLEVVEHIVGLNIAMHVAMRMYVDEGDK